MENVRSGRAERTRSVEDLQKMIRTSSGMVFVDMKGLDSAETATLRKTVRQAKSGLKVVKNRLMRIACGRENVTVREGWLKCNTAVVFTDADPLPVVKAITVYATEHEKMKLKGAIIEGRPLELDNLNVLAALPGRQELLGMAASAMKGVLAHAAMDFRWLYVKMVFVLKEAAKKAS